jgi:hypothetical protein
MDTGIAVPGGEEFVRSYAEWVGKPLVIKRSGDAYRTFVLGDEAWWRRKRDIAPDLSVDQFKRLDQKRFGQREGVVKVGPARGLDLGRSPWGFPGIGMHGETYDRLKGRLIEDLLRETKQGHHRRSTMLLISGIRRAESRQRRKYNPFTERGSAKWVNPLIDWTNGEMRVYREEHGVPESDVAALLHRSGECNCAAKGSWWEERSLIKALWPLWFAGTIESLEREAERLGIRYCRWGGFDLNGVRAGSVSAKQPGPACDNCQQFKLEAIA